MDISKEQHFIKIYIFCNIAFIVNFDQFNLPMLNTNNSFIDLFKKKNIIKKFTYILAAETDVCLYIKDMK